MKNRPLCYLALLLVFILYFLEVLGLSSRALEIQEINILSQQQEEIELAGRLYQIKEKAKYQELYLREVILLSPSQKNKKTKIKQMVVRIDHTSQLNHTSQTYKLGSHLQVTGHITFFECARNPGGYDEEEYYAGKGIYAYLDKAMVHKTSKQYYVVEEMLHRLRAHFKHTLEQLVGQEKASIYHAMLLGDKSELEEEVKYLYQMGGIMHILSISGMHISLLGLGVYEFLKKLHVSNKFATATSTLLLLCYVLLSGQSPATVRAFIMFVLMVFGKVLGRSYDLLSATAASAILLLVSNPSYISDTGFLFSYLAVLGIGIVFPVLKSLFESKIQQEKSKKSRMLQTLCASSAIFMATLPLQLYQFYEIPTYALLVNFIVLPALGIIVMSGMGACMVGVLSLGVGKVMLCPANILLWGYEIICKGATMLPYTTLIIGRPSLWSIFLYYLMLIGMLVVLQKSTKRYFILLYPIACLLLIHTPRNQSTITNLDIGQGDCVVLRTKENHSYLIDAGSSSKKKMGIYILLPYLKHQGIHTLEGIFLTHPDEDHMNGIVELLECIVQGKTSIKVKTVYAPTWVECHQEFSNLVQLTKQADIPIQYLGSGQVLTHKTYQIKVLLPQKVEQKGDVIPQITIFDENKNAGSLVLSYEEEHFRALFTGDMEEAQEKLLKNLRPYTYLKVSHHGSKTASSASFLQAISPRISVISCAKRNSYGHPSKEVIQRLKSYSNQIEYTMHYGAICTIFKNKQIRVERYVDSK